MREHKNKHIVSCALYILFLFVYNMESFSSKPDITDTSIFTNNLNSSSQDNMPESVSWTTIAIIVSVLALLGFNVFVYLAKGTEGIVDIFRPVVNKFLLLFGGVTASVISETADDTKTVVDATAGALDQGLSTVKTLANTSLTSQVLQPPDILKESTLNRILNTAEQQNANDKDYEADDANSNIQNGMTKSGWCLIGEDRQFRSCVEVGVNDKCMSGDIFPSREICVNPSLRP